MKQIYGNCFKFERLPYSKNREKDTETMEFDLEAILKIMDRFDKSNMSEFLYKTDDYTFKLEAEKYGYVYMLFIPNLVL